MKNLSEELNSVKTNNYKYLFIFSFFVITYSAFIIFQVHIIYHILFIIGSILLTIGYEKIDRELAAVKMKNFYIKAKLTYKIQELENEINKNKADFDKKVLEQILDEFEL